ncbi:MAG: ribonuclease III [Sphingomonadaceae bacterium]
MSDESLAVWIESKLGHAPRNIDLFERALTHPSHGGSHYQRLEFLGDRVLGLVIAGWLYARHGEETEGKLAHRFNGLVSREVCADVGREIDLTPWLRLGRQALDDGVFESDNVLGDVVEALIGAIYLDAGLSAAERFIRDHWERRISGQHAPPKHPKAALQELAAARNRKPPAYAIVDRSGPDHRPYFTVKVQVNGLGDAEGNGTSRQEAETAAAKALLEKLT